MESLIEDKSRVIIKRGDYYHMTTVKQNRTTMINKIPIKLDSFVGHKFGSYFEVVKKEVKCVEMPSYEDEDILSYQEANSQDAGEGLDAAVNMVADSEVETLKEEPDWKEPSSDHVTRDEVMSMKKEGVDADAMIKTIVSKNSNFKDKTDFSKTKYIKKKLNRHKLIIQVLKPNSRLITRALFNQENKKYVSLCPMDVANIIYKCNLFPKCKIIVCDGTGGLMLSVILEKLMENIEVVEFFTTEYPKRDASSFFTFDNSLFVNVYPLPFKYANEDFKGEVFHTELNQMETDESDVAGCPVEKKFKLDQEPLSEETTTSCELDSTVSSIESQPPHRNKTLDCARKFVLGPKHLKGLNLYINGGFDCLLLVTKFDCLNLLKYCCKKVAPSRPIVVFHSCLDVIKRSAEWLKEERQAVNIEVTEIFSREYQVLPNRTRPTMKPEETSGYCLTAIKVDTIA